MSALRGAINDVIGRFEAPGWLVAVSFFNVLRLFSVRVGDKKDIVLEIEW